jgi:hypothetical protein
MTRTVPSGFLTALSQATVEPFYAVEMLFDDTDGTLYSSGSYQGNQALRLWTGIGDKVIGSKTYQGAGQLLTIDEAEESNDLSVKGATLTLTGIPTSLINTALATPYQNRQCNIYLGIDQQPDIIEIFSGSMDKMIIEDDPDKSTITMRVEHKLVALERPVVRRYTEESHKAISTTNSNDTFFTFLTDIQDKQISFGRPPK